MSAHMIKLIIFDMAGVILDFTEEQYIRYISKKMKISKKKISHVLLPLIEMSEYGRLDIESIERIAADKLNIKKTDLEWASSFKKLAKLNSGTAKLVKHLSEDYKIAILTNVNASRYDEARKKFVKRLPMEKIRVFTSFSLKMRKPDPRIYRYTVRAMRCKPAETVFIDDRIENIKGAKGVGINAILFKNVAQVRKELSKLKVL